MYNPFDQSTRGRNLPTGGQNTADSMFTTSNQIGLVPLSPDRGLPLPQYSAAIGQPSMTSTSFRPFSFPARHHDRRSMFDFGYHSSTGGTGVAEIEGRPLPYTASDDHRPPGVLDQNEFPSLTSRNLAQGDLYHQNLPPKPYVGSIGTVRRTQGQGVIPFTMSSEDFPALPGTVPTSSSTEPTATTSSHLAPEKEPARKGILTDSEGRVTNIPASMINDQFGMAGLLTFIRAAESNPNLVQLAIGHDLTAVGLNLNGVDSLYPSFGGPLSEGQVPAEDIDYPVPAEYNISGQEHRQDFGGSISGKLAPLKMNRYKDELLFYLFYTYTADVLQLLAASELYNRDWRYHLEEKAWICRSPNVQPSEKGIKFERGVYYFFDPSSWRKIAKEFYLEYEKLEGRPVIPPQFSNSNSYFG